MKLFIAFLILFFSNFNSSHEMNPARLVLSEDANSNYKVTWMFPSKGIGLPAEVSFPDCTESGKSLPRQESKYLITNLNLDCGDSIKGKSITLKGLSRVTDALISISFFDGSNCCLYFCNIFFDFQGCVGKLDVFRLGQESI